GNKDYNNDDSSCKKSRDCCSSRYNCNNDNNRDCKNNSHHKDLRTGGPVSSSEDIGHRGKLLHHNDTCRFVFSHGLHNCFFQQLVVQVSNKHRLEFVRIYMLSCSWRKSERLIKRVELISWQMI